MIFFEVDLEMVKDLVDNDYIEKNCVRHPDGLPKHSVYLSVYRVLETIPLKALKNLYLTTDNGIVLELTPTPYDNSCEEKTSLHLYQELCPVSPQVVSEFYPAAFMKALTDGSRQFKLPKLFFVEMKLGELADNPATGSAEHLPYTHVRHLRDCLMALSGYEKRMKTVVRFLQRIFTLSFGGLRFFMWVREMRCFITPIHPWLNWKRLITIFWQHYNTS